MTMQLSWLSFLSLALGSLSFADQIIVPPTSVSVVCGKLLKEGGKNVCKAEPAGQSDGMLCLSIKDRNMVMMKFFPNEEGCLFQVSKLQAVVDQAVKLTQWVVIDSQRFEAKLITKEAAHAESAQMTERSKKSAIQMAELRKRLLQIQKDIDQPANFSDSSQTSNQLKPSTKKASQVTPAPALPKSQRP